MVSDKQSLAILEKKLPDNKKWSVVLEVDAGYGRSKYDNRNVNVTKYQKQIF